VKEKTQDSKKVIPTEESVSIDAVQTANALSLPPYTPLPRVLRLRGTPRACRRLFSSTLAIFVCAFIFLPFNELNQRIFALLLACLWLRLGAVRYMNGSGQLLLRHLRRAEPLPLAGRHGRCVRLSPRSAFLLARMTLDSGRAGSALLASWRAWGGGASSSRKEQDATVN